MKNDKSEERKKSTDSLIFFITIYLNTFSNFKKNNVQNKSEMT